MRPPPHRHGTATHAEVLLSFSDLRKMDGTPTPERAWLRNHTSGSPVFLNGTAAEALLGLLVALVVLVRGP